MSWLTEPSQHAYGLMLLYGTALRATALLAAAALAAVALRRAPAGARALVWGAALLGVLALPLARTAPLAWSATVLPGTAADAYLALVALSAPSSLLPPPPAYRWTTVLCAVWAAGFLVVALGLVRGWLRVRRTAAAAAAVDDAAWIALLAGCAARVGLRRPVRLLRHPEAAAPLTWGVRRPVVLLPAGADEWPRSHREAVLLHELAHVRRLDCLVQLLAQLACALLWFHPGAWWALHRLRLERELACDDRALDAGARASDYAECLLGIADRLRAGGERGAAVAVGMVRPARPSRLRARLLAVLDERGGRRALSLRASAALVAAGVALFAPVSSARVGPSTGALLAALAHDRPQTRASAAALLGVYESRPAAAGLARAAAGDPSALVRKHATQSLEQLRKVNPPRFRAWGITAEPAAGGR